MAVPPTAGLVGYWNLDEPSGAIANDSSGNGNHGALVNSPVRASGASCKFGGCLQFTSGSRRVDIPNSTSINTTTGFSLAFWYRATSNSGSIAAKPLGTGTLNSWQLEFTGGSLSFTSSGGSSQNFDSVAAPATGTWHLVVASWDGTSKRLYLDGTLRLTVARTISFDAHGLVIGGDYNSGSFVLPFLGFVDDIRLYNRALTAAEVTELYTSAPDATPPVISGVTSSGITSNAATITWTSNEAATTQVEYGTTTAYGSLTTLDASLVTAHTQALTGLTASTLYHYRVRSRDAAGNEAVSPDFTLTTAAAVDTTPPVIGGVTSGGITTSAATIIWSTNEASTTQVEYGTTTAYGALTILDAPLVTAHSQTLSGLSAGTPYHYRVRSRDGAGNEAVSDDFTLTTAPSDTAPPVISGVASSGITPSSATISWTTDEAATTRVEYGTTTAYGSLTAIDASLVTAHSQTIAGLSASTLYHYRVRSRDAAGNEAVSPDFTLTTTASADSTPPIISSVVTGSVNNSSATIIWITNEAATDQVEYGLTTAYGAFTSLNADALLVTGHTRTLTGLSANTLYHYRVRSRDAAGNEAISADFTFTTLSSAAGSFQTSIFVSNVPTPTAIEFAPDGRLFICEKTGRLRVVKNGQLLSTPFVTVDASQEGERGLLGIAFAPDFAVNGYVYVYYTARTPAPHNRLSRFTANGDVAVPGSELVLFDLPAMGNLYHQGGAIHFGADGKLYVAVGNHEGTTNAQSLTDPFGKILRLNPDGTIPADNPFYGQTTGIQRAIWAYGLRNPFTFAVDSGTGRIFVNDVGQTAWEEVSQLARGANYGWPICEGPQNTGVGTCNNPAITYPLHAYPHTVGTAITGGTFYRASQFPSQYFGAYFFGDYGVGWIKYLDPVNQVPGINNPATSFNNLQYVVDLKVGPDGALYASSVYQDKVYKIEFITTANRAPTAAASATPSSGAAPLTVSFNASASSDPDLDPLSFSWNFGDGTPAGSGVTVSHTYSTPGPYNATLTVNDGRGGVASVVVQISVGTQPQGTMITPASGVIYNAGDTISYSGSGTDAEDGALPANQFSWTVVFHHDDHTHPFLGPINGVTSGSFQIPQTGESSANTWYRIHLTVTDSTGLTHTVSRNISPYTLSVTLNTNVPGLSLTLDGQPATAPITFTGVAGFIREIGAPSPQTVNGRQYEFVLWSDGGAQTHNITTPGSETTYTAEFREAPDTIPPVISGVTSSGITSSAATIAWSTDEAATTQIEYGTTTAYGSLSVLNASLVTAHSQTLTGLSASTLYHYRVRSRDVAGNEAVAPDFTFTTAAPPDTTPPVISEVTSSGITSSGATISWTTNETSTTQVEYGLTTAYGSLTTLNAALVTAHTQALTGLTASTLYHYRVRSRDGAGNEAVSSDFTFTTAVSTQPAGLVGYWKLDETTGATATDSSGSGNHGTLVNSPVRASGASCKLGGCLQFTSGSRRVDIPYSASVNTTTGFTVAFWYRATSNSGSIAAKPLGTGTLNSWQLEFTGGSLSFTSSGGSSQNFDTIAAPATGAWHFVVASWSGTSKKLYLDGTLRLTVARTISFDARGLVIGGDYNSGSFVLPFLGFIDEVRLYNRALTDSEVTQLFIQ